MIVYQSDNKNITTKVLFKDGTFWLPQKDIANLFNVGVPTISKYLNNIFRDEGLNENSVVSKMETTAPDGNTHNIYINNTLIHA